MMVAMMDADVSALAGRAQAWERPGRVAAWGGPGSVTLGGLRVSVQRSMRRAADGSSELPVPAHQLFNTSELLCRQLAMKKMLAGLSTRR